MLKKQNERVKKQFFSVRKERKGGPQVTIFLFDLCTLRCSFTFQVNWCRDGACVSASVHVCVSDWAMAVYLCLPLSARCMQRCGAFIPGRALGMLGISPRRSWSQSPGSSHSHPPPAPTPLTDTAQRADTWLYMHTQKHRDTHPRTSGKVRDQQKHSRETGEDRGDQMQESTQQERRGCRVVVGVGDKKVRLKQRQEALIERSTCQLMKCVIKFTFSKISVTAPFACHSA